MTMRGQGNDLWCLVCKQDGSAGRGLRERQEESGWLLVNRAERAEAHLGSRGELTSKPVLFKQHSRPQVGRGWKPLD